MQIVFDGAGGSFLLINFEMVVKFQFENMYHIHSIFFQKISGLVMPPFCPQVWSLTRLYSVDFSKLRIGGKKCVLNKRTIKVCVPPGTSAPGAAHMAVLDLALKILKFSLKRVYRKKDVCNYFPKC